MSAVRAEAVEAAGVTNLAAARNMAENTIKAYAGTPLLAGMNVPDSLALARALLSALDALEAANKVVEAAADLITTPVDSTSEQILEARHRLIAALEFVAEPPDEDDCDFGETWADTA